VSLPHGERIEPPYDLGDQLSVVPCSLLDAEVRDVPRGDEQPVWRLRRDPARELVLPEMIDLRAASEPPADGGQTPTRGPDAVKSAA
jgi:hypothetical protein